MTKYDRWADESIRAAIRAGYTPTLFIRMRQEYGTKGAMKKLVSSPEIESGLKRLARLNLLKLSVEYAVLHHFPDDFTDHEKECARWKLGLARAAA
jgi:hypothetical protein